MLDLGSAIGYLLLDTKGFSSGFTSALQAVKTMQSESATAGDKFAAMGAAMTSVGGNLTRSVTLPLVGIGTAAVHTAANFESAMSQVQATTGYADDEMVKLNGSTVNALDSLSDLAQEMGATTKFSASEAAAAINNMAMAGYEVQEIYDSLPGVLNLASAGALDLDYATQLVANGLNVMGMETSDVNELADKMAVTATKAYGSVSDFGEGLLIAGAQAKLANVSLTDTFTALGILGDNGISASEGGTYLRNTLKNLYTPTEDAADALNELGVKTADSNGELKDFQVVLQELGASLDGLTEEQRITYMSRIFDTRTISAANALIANSTERWDKLSEAIDKSAGSAEQMREAQLNNLTGQLTILKSSIEGAAISFGNILLPVIKKLSIAFQNLMNWLNGLDESQKRTIVTILEIVAAIGPLLLIFGKMSAAISAVIGLFSGTGGLAAALTAITGPIGIVIAAVAALAAMWITDFAGIREATSSVIQSIGEIISTFVGFFVGLWKSSFMGIQDITASVWNAVETLFSTVFSAISGLFKAFAEVFKGDWKGAWEDIKNVAVTIWNGLKSVFSSLLSALVTLLTNIGSSLLNAAKSAFAKIKEGFQIAWGAIKTWVTNAFNSIVDTVSGIAGDMYEAGAAVFTSLYNGFLSVWEKISSWASEKLSWLKNLFSDIEVNVSANTNGSYASGIDYITHDQLVKVHEGEAILTKEENRRRLQAGNRSGGGDTYNFYSPKALNPTTAAREMKKAKQQLALGLA